MYGFRKQLNTLALVCMNHSMPWEAEQVRYAIAWYVLSGRSGEAFENAFFALSDDQIKSLVDNCVEHVGCVDDTIKRIFKILKIKKAA